MIGVVATLEIQDGKQEVEVLEHRLNMVIKVNNEVIMKSKKEILDLSQVIGSMFKIKTGVAA